MSDRTIKSKVIGEGAYGCVLKPSLQCKGQSEDARLNPNKISKLMTDAHATTELNEYEIIARIDPVKKYHLGKPTKCAVKDDKRNRNDIAKCSNSGRYIENMPQYSLLVMDNGGINLENFATAMSSAPETPANHAKMNRFWIEAHRLVKGLCLFIGDDILHHDLKPQNIVYNESTNRLNYIDFGLMTSASGSLAKCVRSKYGFGINHWSFPLELGFTNRYKFDAFAKKSASQRNEYILKFTQNVTKQNYEKPESKAFLNFFTFVVSENLPADMYNDILRKYINDYAITIHNIQPNAYVKFLKKSIKSIDVYGLGIAFMHVLINTAMHIDEELSEAFMQLFYRMITPNINTRITSNKLLSEYEEILETTGLLAEENVHFVDHELKQGRLLSPAIIREIDKADVDDLLEMEIPADERNETPNPCPPGKEINVKTKRCVKKCKEGTMRILGTGRCAKVRTPKMAAAERVCPDGKILNPKTKRCVKAIRSSKTEKKCPDGKVLNPATNRCIKPRKPAV